MKATLVDADRMTVNQSSPWVQGIIGLLFAGLGALFCVLIAAGAMDNVQRGGVPVSVPPLLKVGWMAFCLLFVLLGLALAGYRSGTTLDREAGRALQWESCYVSFGSRSRGIRHFQSVRLESEIREGARDKMNRVSYRRVYPVKLTEPGGSVLLLSETGSERASREAARQVAEFLGLEFTDTTTDDKPLPRRGASVTVELPGIGRLSYAQETPKVEQKPYEFRECVEQPEVPPHDLSWSYHPRWPALGHVHAVWLYSERTGDWQAVENIWPQIQEVWGRYAAQPLLADAGQGGHLHLNRTAAGCLAYARLAHRFRAEKDAAAATRELDRLLSLMLGNCRARAAIAAETLQQTSSRGDTHHNQGRKLYFHLNNHKSKLALFLDLTPELGRALAEAAPAETTILQRWVDRLMPAFYLAFEERSVHYGENFVELPDSVHGLFLAKAFLWHAPADQLARFTDLPWVRADLFHIEKLVHAIEGAGRRNWEKQ
jgi:hypothetical protein